MSSAISFTKCIDCAHMRSIDEFDEKGRRRANREVIICSRRGVYRSVRAIRSCVEFSRKPTEEPSS
jgi:hypothetical protein